MEVIYFHICAHLSWKRRLSVVAFPHLTFSLFPGFLFFSDSLISWTMTLSTARLHWLLLPQQNERWVKCIWLESPVKLFRVFSKGEGGLTPDTICIQNSINQPIYLVKTLNLHDFATFTLYFCLLISKRKYNSRLCKSPPPSWGPVKSVPLFTHYDAPGNMFHMA